jgi:NAD(P)-dependent dehydrogenase (short-subunit alcohol dehydrogenase family)
VSVLPTPGTSCKAYHFLRNTGKKAGSAKVIATKVDVRDPEQVGTWIAEVLKEFKQLDGAANVAGVAGGTGDTTIETIVSLISSSVPSRPKPIVHQVQKDWDFTLGVNLNGVMNCMRAQLPKITRPGGAVVNVASTSGRRGLPHNAAYASSKFAVIGLSESAAGEYAKHGVRINALLP